MTKSKYEVAPGVWIGSEINDIDREIKSLIFKQGNEGWTVDDELRFTTLKNRRMELMMPKTWDRMSRSLG